MGKRNSILYNILIYIIIFLKGKVFGIFLTEKGKQRVHFYQEALPPSQPPLKRIHPSIHSANIY